MAPPYKHNSTVQAVYNAVRSYMMNRGVPAPQFEDLVKMHARAFSMTINEARADIIAHLKADFSAMTEVKLPGNEVVRRRDDPVL